MEYELVQCPYEEACTCRLDEPCYGCETYAENAGVMYLQREIDKLTNVEKQR